MIFVFPFGGDMNMFPGGYDSASCRILHGLDLSTDSWFPVKTAGEQPPPRANHASAVDDFRLYIFGGWDGTKRLSDFLLSLNVICFCFSIFGSNIFRKQNPDIYRSQEMLLKKAPSAKQPPNKTQWLCDFCLRIDDEFLALFGVRIWDGCKKLFDPCWLQFWNRLASWVLHKPGLNDLYVLDTRDNVCLSFKVERIECKFMHWHSAKKLLGPPKPRLFPWFLH